MKNLKRITYTIVLCSLLSSCAAVKYGAIVGAQKSTYTESGDASSLISDDTLAFSSYENDSTGFHIGISEESNGY